MSVLSVDKSDQHELKIFISSEQYYTIFKHDEKNSNTSNEGE